MDEDLMPEPDADLAVRTLRFLDQDGASVLRVHRVARSLPSAPTPDQRGATAFVEVRLDQLTSAALLG